MHGACPGPLKHPAEFQVHPNGHALGVWVMFRLKSHSLNSLRRRRPSYGRQKRSPSYGRPDRSVVESLSIACDTLYAFKSESFPAQAPVREKPLVEVAPLSKWSRRNLSRLPRASQGPGREAGCVKLSSISNLQRGRVMKLQSLMLRKSLLLLTL